MFTCVYPHLRKKIESIIRRGNGIPDPDCPDDPESMQFWCFTKSKFTDKCKVTKRQQLDMGGQANQDFVDSLMDGDPRPASSCAPTPLAITMSPHTDQLLEYHRAMQGAHMFECLFVQICMYFLFFDVFCQVQLGRRTRWCRTIRPTTSSKG